MIEMTLFQLDIFNLQSETNNLPRELQELLKTSHATEATNYNRVKGILLCWIPRRLLEDLSEPGLMRR